MGKLYVNPTVTKQPLKSVETLPGQGVDYTLSPAMLALAKNYADNGLPINQDVLIEQIIKERGNGKRPPNTSQTGLYAIPYNSRAQLAGIDLATLDLIQSNVKWDTNIHPPVKKTSMLGTIVGGFLSGGPIGAIIAIPVAALKEQKNSNAAKAEIEAAKLDLLATYGLDGVKELRGDGIPNNNDTAKTEGALQASTNLLKFQGAELWILGIMAILFIFTLTYKKK